MDKVFSSTERKKRCTDGRERSDEFELGSEVRLHKYYEGTKFDVLLLGP